MVSPPPGGRDLELLLVMIRPNEDKDAYLLQYPFYSPESLESLKGPQILGHVEITTPSYIHKYYWLPGATLSSIRQTQKVEHAYRPAVIPEPSAHPLGTETQAKEVKQVSTLRASKSWGLASSAFRPLGPSRSPATSLSLAGGGRHMAQEAPRLWRAAETCPGSTKLWRSRCPSTEMPGAAWALGRDASRALIPPKRQARPLPYSGPRLPVLARCFTLLGRAARHVWGHSGLQGRRGSAHGGGRRSHGVPNLAEAGEARREAGTLRTTIPTRPCGKPENGPCLNTNSVAQNPWKKKSINIYLIQ